MDEEGARQVAEAVFQALTQLTDRFDANSSEMKVFNGRIKRSSDDFARDMVNLGKSVKRGEAGYKEQQQLLKQLNDAIEESIESQSDATERKRLLEQKKELAEKAHQQNAKEQWQEAGKALGEATRTASTQIVTSAGQFVKGLQAGSSGTELATGLMTTAVDVIGAGAGVVIKGLSAAGNGMASSMNPVVAGFGALAAGLGAAADAARETATKVVKFGIEVAAKEVEKTVKAFNSMSASGAMFADGMTGMRDAAGAAGLTVEQFSQVVKGSSVQLANSGMSVAEAAKFTGKVLQAGSTNMQRALLNLGYGFEEQGELVAQVISDMRGSTVGPLRATEAQVAEQTQKYAENLRIIAAITGEDAKKKVEQVRQQSSLLAFQQKLAQKTPEEQAATLRAMRVMKDQELKNFIDKVAFDGLVVNKQGAIMDSMLSALHDSSEESYRRFQNNTLDQQTQLQIAAKNNRRMQQQVHEQVGVALAEAAGLSGTAADTGKGMGKLLEELQAQTPEAIRASLDALGKQRDSTDGLTKSLTDAAIVAQNLKTAIEIELTGAITNFAGIAEQMLKGVQDMMNELGFGSKSPEKKAEEKVQGTELQDKKNQERASLSEKLFSTHYLARGLEQTAQMGGYGLQSMGMGEIGGWIRSLGEKAQEERVQSETAHLKGKYGEYAAGGIAAGPTTGFPAMLHGTEAVVPLPDGKSIPVQLAMSMEKELLPGLKEFSGLNIGPMRTDLRIVAAMAEKLGAFTQAGGGTITDTKTWKELLGYGTTYDLGTEKVNALGSFQDTRNLKIEDFSKQIQDLVEQFKQDRAAGQTVTPEQAASNIADSNKEMVDLMQRQLDAMQEQTNLTQRMINEQQRGTRVSRDILSASY